MTTLRDIGVAALVNIGLSILFLVSYVFVSLQPVNDRVYYPKLYIEGIRKGRPRASPRQLKPLEKYFNLEFYQYFNVFGWAKSALLKNENDLIQHAGLDSAVFLRIFLVGSVFIPFRRWLKIFVPLMILGMAILVPVNVGAGSLAESGTTSVNANTTETKFLFSSIDKLSMSNVPNQSPRLWAHLVMSYVFTAWVCFILFMEYKSIAALRLRFLSDEKRRPDQFTVMVLQIPNNGVQPLSEQVDSYFHRNHPDFYLTHQMAYNATKLSKIVKERDKAENWLVYFQLKLQRNPAMRPMTKTGFGGILGEQVDAIDYYTARIEQLTQEAETEREVVVNDPKATMPAAFVSFKNRWGAAVCAQTQQNEDPTLWLTGWAPEPRDVYWKNLSIPYVQIGFRKFAVGGIVFLLVFFYLIPIAAVQSLANLEGLRRSIPALDGFLQKSFVSSFVQGFLPGLMLKIFFHFLPALIMLLSKLEGHLSLSKLERRSAAKYYYFVVVNIFFGSILAGSAFQQLKTFVTSSSLLGFINTLALSIPQKASFFITYIMVDGWSGPAGEILRLKPLVKYHIMNLLFCKTDKDRLQAAKPGTISLAESLPQLQLYFLMGLVYSVITPFIIPFIIIFMGFAFVVYRNQVINVYDPEYESAGAFWPHVHGRIIAALILEHITLIGIFLIKGPVAFVETPRGHSVKSKVLRYVRDSCSSTPFMIALPILTLIFHHYCEKRFEAAFNNYPLENAMEKDTIDRQQDPDFNLGVFLRNAYNHPDFTDEQDTADVEKGKEEEDGIEEDAKTALQDNLPARALQDSLPARALEDSLPEDELENLDGREEEQDSSPLTFKWGAFNQAAEDDTNEDSSMSNPLLPSEKGSSALRRRSSSNSGSSASIKRESSLKEDKVEGSSIDILGRYYSARSYFDSSSSRSNFDGGSAPSDTDSSSSSAAGKPTTDGDDSSNELRRVRSLQRYLQGQLTRESSFVESLRSSNETARLASLQSFIGLVSRNSSFAEGSPVFEGDDTTGITNLEGIQNNYKREPSEAMFPGSPSQAEAAVLQDLQRYMREQLSRQNSRAGEPIEDDLDGTLRTAYLQGYLRGQLSRYNSSSESSPLIFRSRSSDKGGNEEEVDLTGSPLTFRRGVLYESDNDESDEIRSASYLQGYVKGQLSRENPGSGSGSPGSPLTFRTGRFGQYVEGGESQDLRTSPLRGSSNQRFPRAQTMSTIRETSETVADAQRGHFSRAKTFDLAGNAASPGTVPSTEAGGSSQDSEITPATSTEVSPPPYSRAKSIGALREVIYLESPSFVRPKVSRSKTLGTLLREPHDASKGSSSEGLRLRKVEKETQTSQKSETASSSSGVRKVKKLDPSGGAESEASTSKSSPGNALGNLIQNESKEQPSKKRKVKKKKADHSSSSSSSTSSSSSSSSSSDSSAHNSDASDNDDDSPNPPDSTPETHIDKDSISPDPRLEQ